MSGTDTRERSYRGISRRAALGYLQTLGGEVAGETSIEGDGWQASVDTDTVAIGPSLTLTEVTVRFEGDPGTLDDLIEAFSQKAVRAGG